MSPQEFMSTIVASIATSTLAVGIIGWFLREWVSTRLKAGIENEYAQMLEIHKVKLKSESDIAIEQLKSKLQIAAAERNIQFSTVFEKTADVISETSVKLQVFLEAVAHYTSIINNPHGPEREPRRIAAGNAYMEFLGYFRPQKMFLPKDTVVKIEEFHKKLHSMTIDFMFKVDQRNNGLGSSPDIDTWSKVHDFMSLEVPNLQELLEDDFRKTLGLIRQEA